jgi:dienelactone hydrolase
MKSPWSTALGRRGFLMAAAGAVGACAPEMGDLAEPEDLVANVKDRAQWSRRREMIIHNMQLVMGELPRKERMPLDIEQTETTDFPALTRKQITFVSEENDCVPAYLFIPKGLNGKTGGMLCLHQTTKIGKGEPAGIGGKPDLHYAKELAERGYVALAPDYPNFGDYTYDPYANGYASATMKGIWNHMRAVDLLQSLDEVDKDRIGCIGHSLGGHNTLYVGAFDERIRAMVTSCGFNSFYKYKGGDLTGWSHKGYMPRIADQYDRDPAKMPFDFTDVLAAEAPRAVFINAPLNDSNFEVSGVRDCVDAARPIYENIFEAGEKLVAVYPEAGHEFPPDVRRQAYDFLDRWVGPVKV